MDVETNKKLIVIDDIIRKLHKIREKTVSGQKIGDNWAQIIKSLNDNTELFRDKSFEETLSTKEKNNFVREWRKIKPITYKELSRHYNDVLCFYYNDNNNIQCGWMGVMKQFHDYASEYNPDTIDLCDIGFETEDTINMINGNRFSPERLNLTADFDGQIFVGIPSETMLKYYKMVVAFEKK